MIYYGTELYHFGIQGQKWGKRNYQNEDGSYTEKGQEENNGHGRYAPNSSESHSKKRGNLSKYLKIGAIVAATALAAYGGYYVYKNRWFIDKHIKLGKKNVDFIKNSGTFDYLDFEPETFKPETFESEKSKLLQQVLKNADNAPDFTKGISLAQEYSKLNDEELRSLQAYTIPQFYKQVNQIADGIYDNADKGYFAGFDQNAVSITNNMMSALKKVQLNKDVNLQRGINESACRKIFGNNVFSELEKIRNSYRSTGKNIKGLDLSNLLLHKEVVGRGFTSTAIPFNGGSVADYFSGKDGIIFEISAKKGQRGIDISNLSELSSEREVLFDVGSSLVLNGKVDIIDGILHIYADMIQ